MLGRTTTALARRRRTRSILAAPLGCLGALALTACGGGSVGAVSQKGASAQSPRGPNLTISLDHTTARSGPGIARSYAEQARVLADPILVSGGRLRVVVSAGAGVAPAVLVDMVVPPERDLRGNARKRFLMSARLDLSTRIAGALGLAPLAEGGLRAAISAMRTDGSDVAGAVFHEVELLAERGGGTVHVLSDGLERDARIDFSRTIERMPTAQAMRELKPSMPSMATSVAISMHGIGLNGHAQNVSSSRSRKLQAVWDGACQAARAKSCDVSTSV